MMGELLTTMVAYDAFTQALTNPLLARKVFDETTFIEAGMEIIGRHPSLEQIVVRRNAAYPDDVQHLVQLPRPGRPEAIISPIRGRAWRGCSTQTVCAAPARAR